MMFLKLTKWEEPEHCGDEPRPIWVNAVKISHMEADTIFGARTLIFTGSACVNVVETPEQILRRIAAIREGKVDA